ncbi:MAG: hypothetical protein B7Y43_00220 [Sphingomonas sp. 28-62-20]|uniref:hypothetical protein n=1 Tax=Sphingomonas sp. 28-62-20 TaxID=1970433 RepID=UPI000BC7C99F|nr:MAG: hypothetical protein B7Y43_00220 [Sphingomonas sp. 28-62-20]
MRSRDPASSGFGIDEAIDRLTRLRDLVHTAGLAIAGRLIAVADFDAKLDLAHHLYELMAAARALGDRLGELAVAQHRAVPERRADRRLIAWLFAPADTPGFVARSHGLLLPALRDRAAGYAHETDALLDAPSLRVLRRLRADLDAMIDAMDDWGAVASAGAPPTDRATCAALDALLDAPEGGHGPRPPRATRCARDPRLTNFGGTRRYAVDDLPLPLRPTTPHAIDQLVMLRIQRDEIDAVETFANIIYDSEGLADADLELLARMASDEARHAAIGQRELARLGLDPFAVPCGTIGIDVRAALAPELALMQINLFGEIHQVRAIGAFAESAAARGDSMTARAFAFIYSDEMRHVREGRQLLRWIADQAGTTLRALEARTRDAAAARLHALGVLGEEYRRSIGDAELARIVGE